MSFSGDPLHSGKGIRPGDMANLIITYWRDIPSALSVKAGRREEKRMLADRFQEAIDMAAMRSGSSDTDSYLADWRRAEPQVVGDDLVAEVEAAKARIESDYPQDKLKALIATGGKAHDP
jgi:hypothetical protein